MINLVKIFNQRFFLFELCRIKVTEGKFQMGWFIRIIPADITTPLTYIEALSIYFNQNQMSILNNSSFKNNQIKMARLRDSGKEAELVLHGLKYIVPIIRQLNNSYSHSVKIDTFERIVKLHFINSTFQRIVS